MIVEDGHAWLEERVSRETMERLEIFHDLLLKWQKTINLVAPSTMATGWERHFVDSAQLWDLSRKNVNRWLDLGSGGGFPGLVIAAIAKEKSPNLQMTLVESDIRKCSFMREAARKMGLCVGILTRRIEDLPPQEADVISARALTSLDRLVDMARPHLASDGTLLFPKGASYQAELETLAPEWQSSTEILASLTDPAAAILRMKDPNPSEPT